ncbi:site-specific integrase, partial [Arthrobacter oryzae]
MDQGTISAAAGNQHRHGHIIAAWQLAQSSPHTLRAYSRHLAGYCGWLDARGLDLLAVNRPILDGYRHGLTGAPATVAARLAALSSFYRYALSAELIAANPVELVKRPRLDPDHS